MFCGRFYYDRCDKMADGVRALNDGMRFLLFDFVV